MISGTGARLELVPLAVLMGLSMTVPCLHAGEVQRGAVAVCVPADAPLAEDSLGVACTTDEDCENEATCIDGVCYVPKNRYVSFRPGNAGTSVAFFVHSPGCPDHDRWVGEPQFDVSCEPETCFADGIPCEGVGFASRLVGTPYYSNSWPEAVHLADFGIIAGTRYEIRAIEATCDTGEPANYSEPLTLPTTRVWGDTVGRYIDGVWQPPNGVVNADDLWAGVRRFKLLSDMPPPIWTDVAPDVPDNCSAFNTMIWVFEAFEGYQFPYYAYHDLGEACFCAGSADCDDGVYCNGAEACDSVYNCAPGPDPCPGQFCDEGSQSCVQCQSDGDCDDGLYCNGAESCDGGICKSGLYPCGYGLCREQALACGSAGGAALSVLPTQASGGDPIIDGNEVVLQGGGRIVHLDVLVSDWDPDLDGVPLLGAYQAALASRQFANGSPGVLAFPEVACISHADCVTAFGGVCYLGMDEGTPCVSDDECTGGSCEGSTCAYDNVMPYDECRAAFVYRGRPDFIDVTLPMADSHTPTPRFGGAQVLFPDGGADDGSIRYLGTFVLEVPDDAAGTYTVAIDPGPDAAFLIDSTSARIPGLELSPALITVDTDCNNNGQVDQDEIEAGTAPDCNNNLFPDSCDIAEGRSEDCTGNGTPDECEPDCNDNGVPDSCDTLGGSEDCNANEIPDECDFAADCNSNGTPDSCECLPSVAPSPQIEVIAKNRYLSFEPDASNPGCTRTALRVTLTDLPAPFDAMEGNAYWVGEPHPIAEASGLGDPDATPPTFTGARLQCTEHCMDWSNVGLVHAFGAAVIPGGSYSIQAVACACDLGVELNYSSVLPIASSVWGDVVGAYGGGGWTAPNGVVDFGDIGAVVDKFKNEPYAPSKARADIAENGPDTRVDFNDIGRVVDAFRGGSYPFAGPTPCE